ncbi:hypothetical protein [Streptomyces zaomyceticus]|uniref:hypothetical protein n=1 Tax=Streptomyces zaomyceticus TaxID=68286 RepID=UPI003434D6E2
MDKAPGPGFLSTVTPLLLESQQLTRQLVTALSWLSTSEYVTVPGSRSTLDTLTATVSSAALVTTHLAQAISVNPLIGASLPGAAVDEKAVRQARETDAESSIVECLAEALHDLDLTATCCSYAATSIGRALERAEASMPLPKLNTKQTTALEDLAQGEGRRYEDSFGRKTKVYVSGGSSVHPATFAFFEKYRLVQVDTDTSDRQGQRVTVTDRARRLLAQSRPATPTGRPAPVAQAAMAGRSR